MLDENLKVEEYDDLYSNKQKLDKIPASERKKMLIELSDTNIHEQKVFLEKAFTNWMGEFEQLDDVCVIGVKI